MKITEFCYYFNALTADPNTGAIVQKISRNVTVFRPGILTGVCEEWIASLCVPNNQRKNLSPGSPTVMLRMISAGKIIYPFLHSKPVVNFDESKNASILANLAFYSL